MPTEYRVELTESAIRQLEGFSRFERNVILDGIRSQLRHQPRVESRNRKPLRPNSLADWELRINRFRVFYDVAHEELVVRIVAVGHKERNQLFVGSQVFDL